MSKKKHMVKFIRENFGRIKDFQSFLKVSYPTVQKFIEYPELMRTDQVLSIVQHLNISPNDFFSAVKLKVNVSQMDQVLEGVRSINEKLDKIVGEGEE